MSLRLKLVLLTSGAIAGVLLFSITLQAVFERRTLLAAQERRQADKLLALSKVCEQALAENDQVYLATHVELLARTEPLSGLALRDGSGRVLFERGAPASAAGRGVPVLIGGVPSAVLEASFDAPAQSREADAAVAASVKRQLGVSVLALLAGVLGAALLAARLTRPLEALVDGARRVGDGDFSHRIPVESADEFGRLGEEFNRMSGRLGELDVMKQSFFETVTHDLRNPLVSVRGYLELFLGGTLGPVTETQREKLQISLRSTFRLNAMIDDFLESSRLQAGASPAVLAAAPLAPVLRAAVDSLSGMAAEFGVSLACELPEGLPPVLMDEPRVHRVLVNLIGNALNFTPSGGQVRVSARRDGERVRVEVRDTGVGLPPEASARLFTRFYQAQETRDAARSKGTGLGLSIAKELIDSQGGDIGAENRPEGGACFWFRLRLA